MTKMKIWTVLNLGWILSLEKICSNSMFSRADVFHKSRNIRRFELWCSVKQIELFKRIDS